MYLLRYCSIFVRPHKFSLTLLPSSSFRNLSLCSNPFRFVRNGFAHRTLPSCCLFPVIQKFPPSLNPSFPTSLYIQPPTTVTTFLPPLSFHLPPSALTIILVPVSVSVSVYTLRANSRDLLQWMPKAIRAFSVCRILAKRKIKEGNNENDTFR